MSGGISLTTVAAAASIASAVYGVVQGQQQASAQEKAQKKALAQADQDRNRANQKKPDTMAILSAAQQSGKAGPSGTMLTGSQGVNTGSMSLGAPTLLGA